jgi:hypothetical protein
MKANGMKIRNMGSAFQDRRQDNITKGLLSRARKKDLDWSLSKTVMSTKVNTSRASLKVKVNISGKMVPNMKVSSATVKETAKGSGDPRMNPLHKSLKEPTKTTRKTDSEPTLGPMDHLIRVNSSMTSSMVLERQSMKMEKLPFLNGLKARLSGS